MPRPADKRSAARNPDAVGVCPERARKAQILVLLAWGAGALGCQLLWPVDDYRDRAPPSNLGPASDASSEASEAELPEAPGDGGEEAEATSEAQEASAVNSTCTSDPSEWTLRGTAVWDDAKVSLTPSPVDAGAGSITEGTGWCSRALSLTSDFLIESRINVGAKESGAFDVWFVFIAADRQNLPAGYRSGGTSVAVEFDTACDFYGNAASAEPCCPDPPNETNCWPVKDDHIALVEDGQWVHGQGLPFVMFGQLEDGLLHPVRIQWSAQQHHLRVSLQNLSTAEWSTVLEYDGDIAEHLGTSLIYYGVSGATVTQGGHVGDFAAHVFVP